MARNGSGVYSLPGTYLAVSGETIEAQQHNDPLEDLEADANNARPIVAGGTGAASAADARTNLGVPSISEVASDIAAIKLPVGSILDYSGSSAPTGWLLCYGQAISRTTYSSLYGVIGTSYGTGDGSTTFNVPDCRGRATFGKDDMGGSGASRITSATMTPSGQALGATGGAQTVTLSSAEMPSHTHTATVTDPGHSHLYIAYGANGSGTNSNSGSTSGTAALTNASLTNISVSNSSTGGGSAHNNMPPAIVFNKIIYADA